MAADGLDTVVEAALAARVRAYAPYSRFLVGAALRTEEGAVFAGCNVENAAFPEGTCAEAGAIAAMVMAGGRHIAEVVVAADAVAPCTPCGGCRQKLREFGAAATRVRMVDAGGAVLLERTLGDLLPDSFGPGNFEMGNAVG
ncbi:cytidine deaminase [Roseomonas elaeocarpi]|uniref:Cytidine deaminase n=1 Tax=Roseomonas elaeocarpi TaxID=907779 RepID=A0ABV6JRN1_9PROT